jgi:hypothetical protein
MNRKLVLAVAGAASLATLAAPALGATRKPINKTYTATAATPDPSNQEAAARHSVCNMVVPGSWHEHVFKAPAAGTLKVMITDFVGDWDLLIQDAKGRDTASAEAVDTGAPTKPDPDSTSMKIKAPGSYKVIACNWAGGPTATVKYTFTYAK